MNMQLSVLAVDDDRSLLASLRRILKLEPIRLLTTDKPEESFALLQNHNIDLLLLDLRMPNLDGIEVLKRVKKKFPQIPVIMLTGNGTIEDAVKAVKLGADDFLQKPCPPSVLVQRIRAYYTCNTEDSSLKSINTEFNYPEFLGESVVMQKIKQLIVRIAESDVSVLIHGETGTGKELVARAIHKHSQRGNEIFVPVDCATISEKILESELFGHCRGAFTGAETERQGLFAEASGGTLFLDEIGEFQLDLQAKLLRVLQERQVRPVGSNKNTMVDIRLLAATNKDLLDESTHGRFRSDLYYRLAAIEIEIPPLRHHPEDIPMLVRHFVCKHFYSDEYSINPEVIEKLQGYNWPGNIRELENVIIRAASLCHNKEITPEDLPTRTFGHKRDHISLIAAMEKKALEEALIQCDGNRRKTSKKLGISEATLYRKIKKAGLSKTNN